LNIRKSQALISVRNVDISKLPTITLIVEALDDSNVILDTLNPSELSIVENGVEKPVLSIKPIQIENRVAVDFVFVVDVTGTMQVYIDGIKNNIVSFTSSLLNRGIDYRLGLITYKDVVETVNQPTTDVEVFRKWMSFLKAAGGVDEKENALNALAEAARIKYRPSASRVVVLVTDAPYHESGEQGFGTTNYTTRSIIDYLVKYNIRTYCITRKDLISYQQIASGTKGSVYDITASFSRILDRYSTQLTNLYGITYRSDSKMVRDSINVAILDANKTELVRQVLPIVEIGRKIIIENLLFPVASAVLPDSVDELEVLYEFMKSRPKVVVRIEGHTDNTGSPKVNRALSLARAEAVRAYLLRKGIDPKRLQAVGVGPSKPIGDNATEFGRRLNRRTEIVIVGK
jgi:outer membrane protein OmpA-like peptidoglycan-associated protein